jgi:hypothetical protein
MAKVKFKNKEQDIIKIKIRCSSEECENLREEGLFFQSIADTLNISREDIEEIEPDSK